jgi:hypothetical protein
MALSRSRVLYLIAMLVSGVAIGLVVASRPEWQQAAISPAFWPFAVSLALELVLGQAVARGKAEPLTMGDRFFGVFGAGLIILGIIGLGA